MKLIDTWPPQILENAASLLVPRPCSRRRTTVSTKAYDARSMEFVVANDTSQYPNGLPAGNRLVHFSPHASEPGTKQRPFPPSGETPSAPSNVENRATENAYGGGRSNDKPRERIYNRNSIACSRRVQRERIKVGGRQAPLLSPDCHNSSSLPTQLAKA